MAAHLTAVPLVKTVASIAVVEASGVLAATGDFLSSDSTRYYVGIVLGAFVSYQANRKIANRNDAPSAPHRRRPALRSRVRPSDVDEMTAAEMRQKLHELEDDDKAEKEES